MKSKQLLLLVIAIFILQSCAVQRRNTERELGPQRFTETFRRVMITEGFHIDNKRIGKWIFRNIDGTLQFSGSYDNDLRVGMWMYSKENQFTSVIFYTEGRVDSINTFRQNGQLAYKLRYTDGDNGFARHYHPNGNLKAFIPITDGKIDGVFSLYFENGQLHRQTEFRAGARYSVIKIFDLQGNDITDKNFRQGTGHYVIYFPPKEDDTALKMSRVYTYEDGEIVASRYFCRNGNITQIVAYSDDLGKFVMRRFNEDGSHISFMDSVASWQRRSGRNRLFASAYLAGDLSFPATFQGGENGISRFLVQNIRYPRTASDAGIEGRVVVQFVVSAMGEIEDVTVKESVSPELDAEAVRVVKSMPRWNPAFMHGLPVRMRFTFPVIFRLE